MSDSRTPDEDSTGADDGPERPPRYEQVIRWAEYIPERPPKVWGPQQNAVVNGRIESAQAELGISKNEREKSEQSESS